LCFQIQSLSEKNVFLFKNLALVKPQNLRLGLKYKVRRERERERERERGREGRREGGREEEGEVCV